MSDGRSAGASRSLPRRHRRPRAGAARRWSLRAATRTSGSRSTARSRRCGSARSSACSATGSTRSRCSRPSSTRSRESPLRGRAHVHRVHPPEPPLLAGRGRASSTAGTRSRSSSCRTSSGPRSCCWLPVAILINVWLAYPIVFAITTVSIFFRPARVAILPRIVTEQDLLSANSAMWVGETIADVIGYPLAGLFVLFLADSLPLAFWFDAATYLAVRGAPGDDGRAADRPPCAGGRRRRRHAPPTSTTSSRRHPRSRPAADRPGCHRGPQGRLGVPAPRGVAAREHDPGHGRAVRGGRRDRRRASCSRSSSPRAGTPPRPRTRSWRRRSAWATWSAASSWASRRRGCGRGR